MRALLINEYGPPQAAQIGEIDKPALKDGALLVRIYAAGINPFDYKLITGMAKDMMPISFPFVPGMDGAGVVAELGSGVQDWRVGDAVLGMFETGTLAEYARVSATSKRLTRKPEGLDFNRAAAMPESGLTANTIVRTADPVQGQTVFIIGATGGVGLFATQLSKMRGARIIATGKTSDLEYLRRLGVDDVIDYGAGDPLEQLRQRYPNGVDVVVDLISGGVTLLRDADVIKAGGKLISSLSGPDQSAFPAGITVAYIQMTAKSGDLEEIARRAASGGLQVEIGRLYAFAEAAQALADLYDPAKHTRGKLVVEVAKDSAKG